jgi:hypothetical protein
MGTLARYGAPKLYEQIDQLQKGKKDLVWISIGVNMAKTESFVMSTWGDSISKIYLIDPYELVPAIKKWDRQVRLDQESKGIRDMKPWSEKCRWIRKKASAAVNDLEDNIFGILYIDGDHSYEAVMEDCRNFWPKMKKESLIIFDDISEFGVHQAVKDFMSQQGIDASDLRIDSKRLPHMGWLVK